MSSWWRLWLPYFAQTRQSPGRDQEAAGPARSGEAGGHREKMSPEQAATFVAQLPARHPVNLRQLEVAVHSLQRRIGNQGAQLLVQKAGQRLRPDQSFADQELEVWTEAFIQDFKEIHATRKTWKPLIDVYEYASEAAQKKALTALVEYFNNQPPHMQRAMLAWLRRRRNDMRDKLLVKHLAARLLGPRWPLPAAPPAVEPPTEFSLRSLLVAVFGFIRIFLREFSVRNLVRAILSFLRRLFQ